MKGKFFLLTLVFLILCGCWEFNPKTPPSPPPPPKVSIPVEESHYLTKGSLYKENKFLYAYTDKRARYVGDILTVKIVENYQSSTTVSQKSSKSSSSSAGIGAFLGYENKINKIFPNANSSKLFEGSMSSSTSGQGQISMQSKIIATISARVIKVLPNGNLVIQGVRTIKRNRDLEYITITGIVRPEDIAPDNSILSTQISDAYIEYSGKGPNSEATSGAGVITRLLQLFWLF
ncbi:flagellar basal body L-ring protein FlgH [Thermodesulfobacterium hydrogeniphilum]|uniref:flagellar basal body L-ring protein FlgH n=1 Tax=Thermodesulfobacterium hydrogeniphilum TaxID=161156 RepID=UPI0006905151|nr:flagellar basal body L-ring protein FlgH [Thermodesulfobacterium hydrogeniphilum]